VNYQVDANYNLASGMTSQTYPGAAGDRRTVSYSFDTAGRLSSLNSGSTSYASSASVSNISYAAHGGLSNQTLGNGLSHQIGYNSRLQPISISLGSALSLNYSYGFTGSGFSNNNGNITNIDYTGGGLYYTQTFTYDSLNRLATANENSGASWTQTNIYDRYGNRLSSDLSPLLTFNANNNRITTAGFSYDDAGNLLNDGLHSYAYDAENKVVKVDGNQSYIYDGEGKRVRKLIGENIRMIYGISGELLSEYNGTTGAIQKEYIYGANGLTATIESSNTQYLTEDHLGSPRIATNSSGAVTLRKDFKPFGEEITAGTGGRSAGQGWGAGNNLRQQFTAYERDNESDLDYAQARYYNPKHGRFTGVDPINITKARMLDPQRFNLYAYVRNNPLKFNDPKGEDVNLANDTEEGRRKALLNATTTLKDSEKKNIGYRLNDKTGKYELFVKDAGKINMNKASAGYKYLTQRIGDSSVKIDYTLLGKGQSVVASDGETYSQKGLANGAGGVTIGDASGNIQVIVAEGGVPNGVKGLTKSGNDVQIAFPDYLVTAHELFGETLKYTPGNQGLQAQDANTRASDSRAVIGIENEIRDSLGVPRRSGKDHDGTFETEVIIRIPK
jgi:RHS repeat-associated protein